ncbi:MAG TPA: helix-turn-helix domain-containing protein [Kofleriaceae bacterium]|nr:helix-turn-helix domain-containing protein [Kofleriaceae bacterium]
MARLNDSRMIGTVLAPHLAVRATTRTFSSPHAAHGIALFVGLEHDVAITTPGGHARGRAVIVAPDVAHSVSSPGPTIGICFDPEALPRVTGFARAIGSARAAGSARSDRFARAAASARADGFARADGSASADLVVGPYGGQARSQRETNEPRLVACPGDGQARSRRETDDASLVACPGGGQANVLDGRLGRLVLGAALAHRSELGRGDVLAGVGGEIAAAIGSNAGAAEARLDRRVARVVEALRDPAAELPRLSISDAHLQELFARDVGVPIRSYRLWHRLMRALVLFAHGDATTAAHAAGFADLAHFSRTCRRFLGYSPTTLRNGV